MPVMLATDRYGYDYGWFLFLFLTAAYLRKYGLPALERRRNALLLYVVYTGHLPMKDFQFPAEFPCRPGRWPLGKPLCFTAQEEAEVCQRMAAGVLKSLKER